MTTERREAGGCLVAVMLSFIITAIIVISAVEIKVFPYIRSLEKRIETLERARLNEDK